MKAIIRNARISPYKVNLVAELIRKQYVPKAVHLLTFAPKKAAEILRKGVESAAANAKTNFKQDPENLMIKEVKVSKGVTYKRFRPVSRGRAHAILKRGSNIIIYLENVVRVAEAPASIPASIKPKETTPKKTASKKPKQTKS